MRDDVAVGNVLAEFEGDGHRLRCEATRLLAAEREGPGIVEAAGEHVGHGLRQDSCAVEVEELPDARSHEADVSADVDPSCVERIDSGDLCKEAIAALGRTGRALLLEELATVLGVLDSLVLAPAPRMPGDDVVDVEQTHLIIARDKGESVA